MTRMTVGRGRLKVPSSWPVWWEVRILPIVMGEPNVTGARVIYILLMDLVNPSLFGYRFSKTIIVSLFYSYYFILRVSDFGYIIADITYAIR